MWIFWSITRPGSGGGKTFDVMTYEEWDRLIRINLTGAYMFTNEVLPYMVKKQHGKMHGQLRRGAGV